MMDVVNFRNGFKGCFYLIQIKAVRSGLHQYINSFL